MIWTLEVQHCPAIIKAKAIKWLHVVNMLPCPGNNSLWRYGIGAKVCKFPQIRHLIPPPIIQGTISGRDNETYLVSAYVPMQRTHNMSVFYIIK